MLTDEEVAAAKALVNASTLGPWRVDEHDGVVISGVPHDFINRDDAAFIAASRTLVPELIAEVERLRAENEIARARLLSAYKRIDYLESLAGEGDE